jgi:hypothetical protein
MGRPGTVTVRIPAAASLIPLLLLATAVLAAVLTPTECSCGAALAHPHPWFVLPGHHHDHALAAASDTTEVPEGPTVTLPPTSTVLGSTFPLLLSPFLLVIVLRQERRCSEAGTRRPAGLVLRPPVPPPRCDAAGRTIARPTPAVSV